MTVVWPGPGGSMLPYEVPLVDHPHQRHHSMTWGLPGHGHRKPQPFYPDIDLHDYGTGYAMDVELPGITNASTIKVEWSSTRDIHVSGSTDRPTTPKAATGDKGTSDDAEGTPTLLVGERRIGPFHRHFHLPVEVDVKNLKAKLENGLLSIRVEKMKHEERNTGQVKVEHGGT
jgi:HSP20 family molecular chaperone IbpA